MAKYPITATELLAELEADPAYLDMRAKRVAQIATQVAAMRAEEAPLIADLEAVGWRVESAWDLVNTRTPYPEALPVLLDHLRRPYSDKVREGIARALAVREARSAWAILLAEYEATRKDSGAKDGLAVALSVVASTDVIGQLAAAAENKANGASRVFLLARLRRSRSPIATAAIEVLMDDPELAKVIASRRPRKQKT